MKKSSKVLLRIIGGIALAGAVLVVVALVLGASWDDVQIGMTHVIKPYKSKYVGETVQLEADELRGLELEVGDGIVSMETWEETYIEVAHNGGFHKYEARMDNGIYEIEADTDESIGIFDTDKEKVLTIRIPEDMVLELMEVSLGAGFFSYEGRLNGNAQLECGAGEMVLNLKGDPKDYNYIMECGIGEIVVNGATYSGIGQEHVIQNAADKTIHLECGVGQIEVVAEK